MEGATFPLLVMVILAGLLYFKVNSMIRQSLKQKKPN